MSYFLCLFLFFSLKSYPNSGLQRYVKRFLRTNRLYRTSVIEVIIRIAFDVGAQVAEQRITCSRAGIDRPLPFLYPNRGMLCIDHLVSVIIIGINTAGHIPFDHGAGTRIKAYTLPLGNLVIYAQRHPDKM